MVSIRYHKISSLEVAKAATQNWAVLDRYARYISNQPRRKLNKTQDNSNTIRARNEQSGFNSYSHGHRSGATSAATRKGNSTAANESISSMLIRKSQNISSSPSNKLTSIEAIPASLTPSSLNDSGSSQGSHESSRLENPSSPDLIEGEVSGMYNSLAQRIPAHSQDTSQPTNVFLQGSSSAESRPPEHRANEELNKIIEEFHIDDEEVHEDLIEEFENCFSVLEERPNTPFIVFFADNWLYLATNAILMPRNIIDPRIGEKLSQFPDTLMFSIALPNEPVKEEPVAPPPTASGWHEYFEGLGKFLDNVLSFGTAVLEEAELIEPQRIPCSARVVKHVTRRLATRISQTPLAVTSGMNLVMGSYRLTVTGLMAQGAPLPIGMCTSKTQLIYDEDDPGEFESLHICPFLDTVPDAYDVDLVSESIHPYFTANPLRRFSEGDRFISRSVEYKILGSKPSSQPSVISYELALSATIPELIDKIPPNSRSRRIGPHTAIYLGHSILPHWVDVLPHDRSNVVMALPAPLQTYAMLTLLTDCDTADIERVLRASENTVRPTESPRTRAQYILKAVGNLKIDTLESGMQDQTCTICLEDFADQPVVQLSCKHIFHMHCVSHWLARSAFCPMCKAEYIPEPAQ